MGDNVELVRGAYSAFARGDMAALIGLVDDSVRWTSPGTLPQGGDYTGKEGVTRFFEGVGGAWERLEIGVDSLGEIGSGLVVGVVQGTGTLRSGEAASYGATHVFTVEGGKVTSFREFVDVDKPIAG